MKNMNRHIGIMLVFALVLIGLVQSCDTMKVEPFGEERALYFEKRVYVDNEWKTVDTAVIAITNYPGQEELRHPFRICLIGDVLPEDTEYSLVEVDSMTTARKGMVTLPERLVFRKGVVADSLWLTLHTTQVGVDEEYYITFRLVPDANFGAGLKGYQEVKLWFNNKQIIPLWWDKRVVQVYLGEWSPKKFETLVLATGGINSFEGLSASEMRRYALVLKDYIRANGTTEADGSPMIVPIY